MIEADLRTKLLADNVTLLGTNGLAVTYNHTPENAPSTRIYFVRSETTGDDLLNGVRNIEHVLFDVECISLSPTTSIQLADAIRALGTFTGTMGSTWVLACDVTDQSDDYVFHHDYADEGLAVDALRVEIMV